jgi:hypothetical protein
MCRLLVLAVVVMMAGCGQPESGPIDASTVTSLPLTTTSVAASASTTRPRMPLSVTEPASGANLAEPRVIVRGEGEPGAPVSIEGGPGTQVSPNGSWELAVDLEIGPNRLVITDPADEIGLTLFVQPDHPLAGETVTARWGDTHQVQEYLLDGTPTGLYSGSRYPVAWTGDAVSAWLGLAHRWPDGLWSPDRPIEVTVMALSATTAGEEEMFVVTDAVDVEIAGGDGTVVATCFVDGSIRHAASLDYTNSGPRLARLWRVDGGDLVEIDPAESGCPDLTVDTVDTVHTVGRIFLAGPYDPAVESCGGLVDLSGSTPTATGLWTHSGACLDQEGWVFDHIVSVVSDQPEYSDEGWRQLWLEDFLGWNLDGTPIFRVAAALDLPPGEPVHVGCRDTAGNPVVVSGDVDVEGVPTGTAWRVLAAVDRFVEVDPADVRCEVMTP